MAEHRVELVQFGGAALERLDIDARPRSATSANSSSSCGRNSCSGGSSRRIVTGRPGHHLEDLGEIGCAVRAAACRARRAGPPRPSARIIWRTAVIRAASKNICSVRHSPMPSAPNSRAVRQSSGVSALARTFRRRTSSAQTISVPKSPDQFGLHGRHLAGHHLAGRAVDGDACRLRVTSRPPTRITLRLARRSTSVPAPETQGRPMPRATTAAWLVMPPRAVRMPLRRVHAVNVFRAGLDADEDHRLARSPRASRRCRLSNTTVPDGRAGRGGQALGQHVARRVAGRASGGAAGRARPDRRARPLPPG